MAAAAKRKRKGCGGGSDVSFLKNGCAPQSTVKHIKCFVKKLRIAWVGETRERLKFRVSYNP